MPPASGADWWACGGSLNLAEVSGRPRTPAPSSELAFDVGSSAGSAGSCLALLVLVGPN